MDFGSLFHFPHRCGMGILEDLLAFLIQSPADFHDIVITVSVSAQWYEQFLGPVHAGDNVELDFVDFDIVEFDFVQTVASTACCGRHCGVAKVEHVQLGRLCRKRMIFVARMNVARHFDMTVDVVEFDVVASVYQALVGQLDRGLILLRSAPYLPSASVSSVCMAWPGCLTFVLQCYDAVSLVMWPVKSLPKWPIYTVFRKKHPLIFSCITLRKGNQFEWKFQTK